MARPAVHVTLVTCLAAGVALAGAATAGRPAGHGSSHGALKAGLVPTTTYLPTQCAAASSGAATGFAVLNAPGRPGGAPHRVIGTVSLKRAAEHSTTFEVDLAVGSACQDTGARLVTNAVGNGAAHFSVALPTTNTATSYYVVLKKSALPTLPVRLPVSLPLTTEAYATAPVALS